MLVGYARVSTAEQKLSLQEDALQQAGCEKIFTDVASGAAAERRGLQEAVEFMRTGDSLVVWRLDRVGRSLRHLIEFVGELQKRKQGFRSLQEQIDTTSRGGKLVFHLFGALAEFERSLIQERTRAGLAAARARGRKGGRPRSLTDRQIRQAVRLYKNDTPAKEVCETFGISKATLYRYLASPPEKPRAKRGKRRS